MQSAAEENTDTAHLVFPPVGSGVKSVPFFAALAIEMLSAVALVAACSSVSRTPLSDAAKIPRSEYLYGPTGDSVVALVDTEEPESAGESDETTSDEAEEEDDGDDDDFEVVVSTDPDDSDEKTSSQSAPVSVAGTYKGTDWVTITLPGFPEDEQVDDQARVVLAVLDKPERYSFAVLDTRTGDELCKIVGSLRDSIITFDEGQSCFAGILGVPMEANMGPGMATIDGNTLTVTLGVELSVNTPNGELTGNLDYRFEGKK